MRPRRTSTIADVPTTALTFGTPVTAQAITQGSRFHTIDLTTPVWIEYAITATTDWGAATVSVEGYDLAGGGWLRSGAAPAGIPPGNVYPLTSGVQPSVPAFAPMGRVLAGDTRDQLVRVKPSGTPGAAPSYSLVIRDRTGFEDLGTIVAGTPVLRTINGLANGAPRRYFARSLAGNTLQSLADPVSLTVDIREVRLNNIEGTVATFNANALGGDETLVAVIAPIPDDWVAWTVENLTPVITSNVNLTVTATTP